MSEETSPNETGDPPAPEMDAPVLNLPLAVMNPDMTVRDDQHEYPWFLDAVRLCRRRGGRFRLVDSGAFDRFQLEWLLEAGADFYSSDEARTDERELTGLRAAGRKGRGILAYFLHRSFGSEDGEDESNPDRLLAMGRSGIDLHVSSRDRERDPAVLVDLAESCRAGKGRLIYYHHGGLNPELEDVARAGAWIHMADSVLAEAEETLPAFDMLRAARSQRANLVVHLKRGLEPVLLEELLEAGAVVLFQYAQIDYRSPLKALERKAARRRLPFRAYYLYPTVLP